MRRRRSVWTPVAEVDEDDRRRHTVHVTQRLRHGRICNPQALFTLAFDILARGVLPLDAAHRHFAQLIAREAKRLEVVGSAQDA